MEDLTAVLRRGLGRLGGRSSAATEPTRGTIVEGMAVVGTGITETEIGAEIVIVETLGAMTIREGTAVVTSRTATGVRASQEVGKLAVVVGVLRVRTDSSNKEATEVAALGDLAVILRPVVVAVTINKEEEEEAGSLLMERAEPSLPMALLDHKTTRNNRNSSKRVAMGMEPAPTDSTLRHKALRPARKEGTAPRATDSKPGATMGNNNPMAPSMVLLSSKDMDSSRHTGANSRRTGTSSKHTRQLKPSRLPRLIPGTEPVPRRRCKLSDHQQIWPGRGTWQTREAEPTVDRVDTGRATVGEGEEMVATCLMYRFMRNIPLEFNIVLICLQ